MLPRRFKHVCFPARRVLCSNRRLQKRRNPDEINSPGFLFWRRPTLARPIAVLPSGLQRFTAVFGMGTGGATALLSPECGTALAVSLLSQRRKRDDVLWRLRAIEVNRPYLNLISKNYQQSTNDYQPVALVH